MNSAPLRYSERNIEENEARKNALLNKSPQSKLEEYFKAFPLKQKDYLLKCNEIMEKLDE